MKYRLPILLCVAAAGLAFACKPDATPKAKEAEEWANKFYTKYTIRGGWGFFGASAKDSNVEIEINVPEEQAKELMDFNPQARTDFIAKNTCPPSDEKVWSILEEAGDFIIHTRLNGNMFAEVSCRKNMRGY